MIYLDNAATTFHKPESVVEAVSRAMHSMGNSGRGAHNASLDASRVIYETRERLAALFGAERAQQVAFTNNATESLNIALHGILKPGDHVITTQLEHNSVLRPLYRLEEQGTELTVIPADAMGRLCYAELEGAVRKNTKAVVCTHASNLTGNLTDIGRIGGLCRERGIIFVVDASQTAGVFPIDMKHMGIDIVCFTGHKGLLGPQGTGGICVDERISLPPFKTGGSGVMTYSRTHPAEMPTVLEAGTLNGHSIAGLLAALIYIEQTGMEAIRHREQALMRKFHDGICRIPDIRIYGDFSVEERAAIVAMNIGDYDSSEVSDELFERFEISTRPGAHCAPLMHEALGTVEQGAVRFSFSHFNTEEETEAAIAAVRQLTEE